MDFYTPSPEVAAAAADLYAEASPLYRCACGFSTALPSEHLLHRTGGTRGTFAHEVAGACDATWSTR